MKIGMMSLSGSASSHAMWSTPQSGLPSTIEQTQSPTPTYRASSGICATQPFQLIGTSTYNLFRLARTERSMTCGFQSLLMKINPQELAPELLSHMPNKSQQVLGRSQLKPIDLLDLPKVEERLMHRLTYLDVPARVGSSNITNAPSTLVPDTLVGSPAPRATSARSMGTKGYFGFTMARRGGHHRPRKHEKEANRVGELNLHYRFSRQADVVPDSRVVGAWTNPQFIKGRGVKRDVSRWLPVFLEGLIMVYLGTYHQNRRPSIASDASYELVDEVRYGMGLPDFHAHSLNRAWPLVQGVRGGMVDARCCANPDCQRPKTSTRPVIYTMSPDVIGTAQLLAMDGPLSRRVCEPCYRYAKPTSGSMRSREGSAHGF